MKKLRLLSMFMFILLTLVLISCGGGKTEGHTCHYTTKVIEPTCYEQGYTEYFCPECENMYTDNYVPARGHIFDGWKVIKPATETEEGVEANQCQYCDYREERPIQKLEHVCQYETEWSYNDYEHWHTSICHNDTKKDVASHNYVEYLEEIQEGEYVVKYNSLICQECGYIQRGSHECEYETEWSYDVVSHWFQATCGHGQQYPEPHSFSEYRYMVEEDGYMRVYVAERCKCGYEINTQHEHEYETVWKSNQQSHWYASTCGHDDAIIYYEHEFTSWNIIYEATEYSEGLKEASCVYCQYFVQELIPMLDHTHKFADELSFNETHHWYASTCGHDVKEYYMEHNYTDWIIREEATEYSVGLKDRRCMACNYVEQEVIPMLEHTHKFADIYTYDELAHWLESTCEHEITDGYELHNYVNIYKKIDPTNTTGGQLTGTCSICNYNGTIAIPALDEVNYEIIEYIVKPDCSTVGRAVYQIKINNETVEFIGEAYSEDHVWVDGVCSKCGEGKISVGFEYQLSSSQDYYTIIGIGSNTDAEVVIPKEYAGLPVRFIGKYAFKDCTQITYVLIPQDVYVLEGAFSGCYNITEINLGRGSYFDIDDNNNDYPIGWIFGKEEYEGSYKATQSVVLVGSKYGDGRKSFDFYVPNKLKKVTFTSVLAYNSLQGFTSVEEVVLTKDTYIPQYAFSGCSSLSKINLENITYIDDYGFYGCSNLDVEYILTAPLISLGGRAIAHCKLTDTHLNIPEKLKSLGFGVFEGLTSIEELTINGLCKDYDTFSTLFGVTGVETAPVYNLKKITVRDPHVYGSSSFELPDNVEEVILHQDSVILVPGTFYGVNIYNVYENGRYLGTKDNPYYFLVSASSNIIHEDCKVIAGGAFNYASSITSLVIPETVEEITVGALNGLSNIEEISLPFIGSNINGDVEYVDLDGKSFGFVFASYSYTNSGITFKERIPSSLKKVHIVNANFWNSTFYGATGLEEVIADNVLYQGSYVYGGCSNIHTITLGNVSMAGSYFSTSSFENSVKITQRYWKNNMVEYVDYYIPASLKTVYIHGVISEDAFYDFECIENVIIKNCEGINDSAFSSIKSLKSVTIEEGIVTIGNYAFAYCSSLTDVNLPASLTTICANAFVDCTSLEEIELPVSLTTIDDNAFKGCTNLKDITINGALTSIGKDAFLDCTSLENVYVNISYEEWCNIDFENKYSNPMSYAANIYFTDENGEYVTVTEIDFSNALENVSLDNKLIGMNSLTKLVLPYAPKYLSVLFGGTKYEDNITLVPSSLETVIITGGTNIPMNSFEGCSYIKEIILPETIKILNNYAFADCSSIEEIVIPNSVENIYSCVLKGCSSLTTLTIPFIGDEKDSTYYKNIGYIFGSFSAEDDVDYIPASLTKLTISGNIVIRPNSFEALSNLTYLDISNASLIEASALVGCNKLEYLGIANPYMAYERIALAYLFGATSFGDSYKVPTSLKTLKIDNTEVLWDTLAHLVSIDNLYLGKNISIIRNTFEGLTVKNVYFEGTIDEWLDIDVLYSYSNPNHFSGNFFVQDSEGNYHRPLTMTLDNETIGYEVYKYTSLNRIYIENTVKEFNTSFVMYDLNTVYYNGTLEDWMKISFASDTSNPARYTREFFYKDSNGEYVLFNGEIELTDGITQITQHSLQFNNLTKLVLSDSIESVSSKAFLNTDNLQFNVYGNANYLGSKNNPYMVLFSAVSTDITSVDIHEDTKIISANAFKDCENLIEIIVPDTVENIERNAFNTNSLEKITMPITNMDDLDSNGNAYFTNYFVAKSSVTNQLPANLTTVVITSTPKLKQYYFSGCSTITSLTLPEDVEYEIYALDGLGINTNEYKNGYYIGSISNPYMLLFKGIDKTVTEFKMHPDTVKVDQGALSGFDKLEELTINFLVDNTNGSNYIGVLFATNRYVVTSNSNVPTTLKTVKVLSGEFSKYTFKGLTIDNLYITKECTAVEDFGGFTALTNLYFDGTLEDWMSINFVSEKSSPMYYASYLYLINESDEYQKLEELVIPESVTRLNNYQFMNINSLKTIVIPNTVEFVGEKVFYGCNSVTTLNIPFTGDSTPIKEPNRLFGGDKYVPATLVTLTIDGNTEESKLYQVFTGFSKVVDLYLTKNVTKLYSGVSNLSSLVNIYYEGTLEDWMNIDVDYHGNPLCNCDHFYVKEAGNYVEITELDLSNYNTIGRYQFSGLRSLTKLKINGGSHIGTNAFDLCNIAELEIVGILPNDMSTMVNVSAVETLILTDVVTLTKLPKLNKIKALYLPNTLNYVNNDAFTSNDIIETIYYVGTVEDWCDVSFGIAEASPLANCEHFYYYNGEEYQLFDNIEVDFEVGMFQFAGSKDLTTLVVLEGGSLSDYSLYNCENLKNLTVNVESLRLYMCFSNNEGKTTLPTDLNLTLTGNYTMDYSLTNWTFDKVYISSSITEFGKSSFYNSTINELYYDGTMNDWFNITLKDEYSNPYAIADKFYVKEGSEYVLVESLEIPSDIEIIKAYQFARCKFTSLEIPSTVKTIEGYAFMNCTGLSEIVIPSTVEKVEKGAFNGCNNVVKVTLPFIGESREKALASTTSNPVGFQELFGYSPRLNYQGSVREVVLTEGIMIPASAFNNCRLIEKITLPEGITTINNQSFGYCQSLQEITIPATVTLIETYAFYQCTGLKELHVPTQAVVKENAFQYCTGLEELTLPNVNPATVTETSGKNSNNFKNIMYYFDTYTASNFSTYLPKLTTLNIVGDTNTNQNNKVVTRAFEGAANIAELNLKNLYLVDDYAFTKCNNLTSVSFENVKTLDVCAFQNCIGLTELSFSGVTSYKTMVFDGCSNVTDLIVNTTSSVSIKGQLHSGPYNTITVISGSGAAFYSTTIDTIVYEETATAIAANGFSQATVTNLYLPKTLETIGMFAFDDANITNLYYDGTIEDWQNVSSSAGANLFANVDNFYFKEDGEYVLSSNYTSIYYTRPEMLSGTFAGFDSILEVVISKDVISVNQSTFTDNTIKFYYEGTETEWKNVRNWSYFNGTNSGLKATVYFYNELEPMTANKYWHFVDGKPTLWSGLTEPVAYALSSTEYLNNSINNDDASLYLNSTITLYSDGTFYFDVPSYRNIGYTTAAFKGYFIENGSEITLYYNAEVYIDGSEYKYSTSDDNGVGYIEGSNLRIPLEVYQRDGSILDILYGIYTVVTE